MFICVDLCPVIINEVSYEMPEIRCQGKTRLKHFRLKAVRENKKQKSAGFDLRLPSSLEATPRQDIGTGRTGRQDWKKPAGFVLLHACTPVVYLYASSCGGILSFS